MGPMTKWAVGLDLCRTPDVGVSAGPGLLPAAAVPPAVGELVDLQLVTVDPTGRVPLRRAAAVLGWQEGTAVELGVHDGVLRFARVEHAGVELRLDSRLRVQLPYGVRETTAFQAGERLVLLAVAADACVVAAPLSSLVDRFRRGL